ncbi:MAG: glucokinase [Tahibacter sp.]
MSAAAAGTPFIAADVGGTHARIGLVRQDNPGSAAVSVLRYDKFVCADFPNLGVLLKHFVGNVGAGSIERVAIACAGYAIDDTLINTNLPWTVSLEQIRRELGVREVALVNDFEAVAHATQYVNRAEATLLAGSAESDTQGPVLVVGPGTGLGAAVRIPHGTRSLILATESGQAALAPGTELEIEILRVLLRQSSHVSNETVLSGPGLVNLYLAISQVNGVCPLLDAPSAITEAALKGSDPVARESLAVFCGLLGSVVGNLVLLFGARGGVYLAGGILPHIREFLLQSSFSARFLDKGPMRAMLERVPVNLIEHGQLGVVGAASWYLETHSGT